MIYGTVVTSAIALLIAVPVGLGVSIFLSENYLPPKIQLAFVFLVELLAAIPSVVYGLWGIFVLIPILRNLGQGLMLISAGCQFLALLPLDRECYQQV